MVQILKPWTGIGLKIVERAGDKLQDLLHKSDPWDDQDCLRKDCPTCRTSMNDEKSPYKNCKKRSVTYETWCITCLNKHEKENKNMLDNESELGLENLFNEKQSESVNRKRKNVKNNGVEGKRFSYIGESSRSVYERGIEHEKNLIFSRTKSHMLKHCLMHHPNIDPNIVKFGMRVISSHKTAFERQIKEAVMINRMSGPYLMNSKSEFSRCTIPRIVLKMGNSEPEVDPDIVREKEIIDKIKTLYPENVKKRNARKSEAVKTTITKPGRKKMRLDLAIDGVEGNQVNTLNTLPIADDTSSQGCSKINLQLKPNPTCGQNYLERYGCMGPVNAELNTNLQNTSGKGSEIVETFEKIVTGEVENVAPNIVDNNVNTRVITLHSDRHSSAKKSDLRGGPDVLGQSDHISNDNTIRQDCELRVNSIMSEIDENKIDKKDENEFIDDENKINVVDNKIELEEMTSQIVPSQRSVLGDQRHLLLKTSRSESLEDKKTTVKSRIKEFESKNYTGLVKRTPIKVKRGKIGVKSPKLNVKTKSPAKKNSPLVKLKSNEMKVNKDEIEVNKDKIKKLIGNLNENVISNMTPSKLQKVQDDDFLKTNEVNNDNLENAFQRLMGAKGGTLQKTPVRVKVKRIERRKVTISEKKFMDLKTWASKKPENE